MSLAHLGERQVFFETRGSEGEQVVLLHSLGADHSVFEEQARALSRKYSVLTFDMRGQNSGNGQLVKMNVNATACPLNWLVLTAWAVLAPWVATRVFRWE